MNAMSVFSAKDHMSTKAAPKSPRLLGNGDRIAVYIAEEFTEEENRAIAPCDRI